MARLRCVVSYHGVVDRRIGCAHHSRVSGVAVEYERNGQSLKNQDASRNLKFGWLLSFKSAGEVRDI